LLGEAIQKSGEKEPGKYISGNTIIIRGSLVEIGYTVTP